LPQSRAHKILIALLKYGVSLGIIAYLFFQARNDKAFAQLVEQPKDWSMFAAAWACCMLSLAFTMIRWHGLVRALDMPFAMRDAFRLGFLGYLFNFVSFGAVGGDVVKAIALVREQPNHRAEAVATVLVDRIVGLYALLVFASACVIGFGQLNSPVAELRTICVSALIGTAVMTGVLIVLMMPAVTRKLGDWKPFGSEKAGHLVRRISGAMSMYRQKPAVLASAMLYSFGVHGSLTICMYLISRGLPGNAPDLMGHFIAVPLSLVTGVLPLPVNGLGAFEYVLNTLYQVVPSPVKVDENQGFLVALVYRLITIAAAMVGVVFYLMNRKEMADILHSAEAEEEAAEEELEHMPDDAMSHEPSPLQGHRKAAG
jgi:uncharacterized protein (TIRG00374 family)